MKKILNHQQKVLQILNLTIFSITKHLIYYKPLLFSSGFLFYKDYSFTAENSNNKTKNKYKQASLNVKILERTSITISIKTGTKVIAIANLKVDMNSFSLTFG